MVAWKVGLTAEGSESDGLPPLGRLATDQKKVRGSESASGEAPPSSCMVVGVAIVWSGPASAVGAELPVVTVTVSARLRSVPSSTMSWAT